MVRGVIAGAACLFALSAQAHEFIVKPGATEIASGATFPVTVLSSHVFMQSEELEPAKVVAVFVVSGGKRTPVTLAPDEATFTYAGSVTAPSSSGFIIAGSRLPQIWSLTPEGLKQGTPAELPGARRPLKIEKFSKTLVNLSAADETWKQTLGDRLEVVPMANPAMVKPGQDLRVQILFDGKPLSTRVYATYDGFTDTPNSYAYFTETADDGTAKIRITQPGLWMVRVEQRMDEKATDHEQYMARAVTVFQVKG